jgi:hypothetical protein
MARTRKTATLVDCSAWIVPSPALYRNSCQKKIKNQKTYLQS